MLTQADIKIIEEIVDEKIGSRTKLLPTREEFFTKMDAVMGELKATREAVELHTGQHIEIHDELENHDKRLKRLEKHTKIPPLAD